MLVPIEKNAVFVACSLDGENHWKSLQDIFSQYTVTTPLCLFPPTTYLEPLFYYAARMCGLPVSSGTVYNHKATAALVHLLKHDVVVTTREVYREFLQLYQSQYGGGPPFKIVCVVEEQYVTPLQEDDNIPIVSIQNPLLAL